MRKKIKFTAILISSVLCVYFSVHTIVTQIRRYAMPHTVLVTEESDGKFIEKTYTTNSIAGFLGKIADFAFGGNFADGTIASAVSANIDKERPTVIDITPSPSPPPENPSAERNIAADNGKTRLSSSLSINNETKYNLDKNQLLDGKKAVESKKKVLIVHTHATESYQPDENFRFTPNSNDRNTDNNYNMVKIGDVLADELSARGIDSLHIRTQHDYPEYNNSYARSCESVENVLKENPDISIVLDIHRDAINLSDGTKAKLVCDINGEKAAQVMLVVGTDELGLKHDTWKTNLKFAVQLQQEFLKISPDFPRPVNLRTSRFNGHLAPGAVIIEVGCAGNSFSESYTSVKYIAEAISNYLES